MSQVAKLPTAEDFAAIQDKMLQQEQVEIPVKHYFCNGVYIREIRIPKNTIALGKIHKTDHLNITVGDVTAVSPLGRKRLKGHCTDIYPPGQCIAYAHEDTVWSTIISTPETDPVKIEAAFIAKDNDELMTYLKSKLLEKT